MFFNTLLTLAGLAGYLPFSHTPLSSALPNSFVPPPPTTVSAFELPSQVLAVGAVLYPGAIPIPRRSQNRMHVVDIVIPPPAPSTTPTPPPAPSASAASPSPFTPAPIPHARFDFGNTIHDSMALFFHRVWTKIAYSLKDNAHAFAADPIAYSIPIAIVLSTLLWMPVQLAIDILLCNICCAVFVYHQSWSCRHVAQMVVEESVKSLPALTAESEALLNATPVVIAVPSLTTMDEVTVSVMDASVSADFSDIAPVEHEFADVEAALRPEGIDVPVMSIVRVNKLQRRRARQHAKRASASRNSNIDSTEPVAPSTPVEPVAPAAPVELAINVAPVETTPPVSTAPRAKRTRSKRVPKPSSSVVPSQAAHLLSSSRYD